MIRTDELIGFIREGIEEHIICDEGFMYIGTNYTNETDNSVDVEFVDFSTQEGFRKKYKITVESIG